MANNQRKMMRSMAVKREPYHDVVLAGHTAAGSELSRAAKKQVKTREDRSWRRDALEDLDGDSSES